MIELRINLIVYNNFNFMNKKTTRKIKDALWWVIPLLILIVIVLWIMSLPKKPNTNVISNRGVHWHSNLSIKIKGKDIEVPAGIGIGAVHNPMHTHKNNGAIHMEYGSTVRGRDVMLSNFFDVWGKDFSSTEIMGNKVGTDGNMRMYVNGEENSEFNKYQMKDGDEIEIIFE